MTNEHQRLYYDDAYLREFDATVSRVEAREGRTAVWLDRTAFYPTSGGQPFDTGSLADRRVVEVVDEGDGVVHLVQGGDQLRAGDGVHGAIDWARRFDHMQHHTGQHVLSAAIVHRFKIPTLSVHLGHDVCTIDIARELSIDQLTAAEDDANRVVGENRAVAIRYATAEEAATLGLRKPSQRHGTLRLIDVDGFDLSACGGTHVRHTGAIGGIVITSWERFKGGQRISFLCGSRAVRAHGTLRDTVSASVRLLSVLPAELPSAIARLQNEHRDRDRIVDLLQRELAAFRAAALADAAEPIGSARWVLHAIDADAQGLRTLAQAILTRPGLVVALVSTTTPVLLVVARSPDLTTACDSLVKILAVEFGGRGGGRPDFAQAGALATSPDVLLARVRALAAGG